MCGLSLSVKQFVLPHSDRPSHGQQICTISVNLRQPSIALSLFREICPSVFDRTLRANLHKGLKKCVFATKKTACKTPKYT